MRMFSDQGRRAGAADLSRKKGAHGKGRAWMAAAFVACAALLAPDVARAQQTPTSREQIQMSFAPLVKRTAPAVVNIFSKKIVRQAANPLANNPFFQEFFQRFGGQMPGGLGQERVQNSLGSGVIIRPDGLIVTNHHVIKEADQITVVLADRREFEAKIVRLDERTDLAVLKIEPKEALPALAFGDSDALEVGDLVLAIGNPFGVGQTVTSGIVSAVARTQTGVSDFRSFIQTDAAINPGNSGGALVTLDGRLIGVNTAIFSRSGGSIGIGFAIPAAMVRAVVEGAASGTRVVRPWLGAGGQAVTADMAEALGLPRPIGVQVNEILPDGPAARAGLRIGDVITAVDGREVDDDEALRFRVATLRIGSTAQLTIQRQGRPMTLTVQLQAPPENPPREQSLLAGPSPFAGAVVVNLSPALVEELGLRVSPRGVMVLEIQRGSTANRVGILPGDVLLQVNGRDVQTVSQIREISAQKQQRWRFSMRRNGQVVTGDLQG